MGAYVRGSVIQVVICDALEAVFLSAGRQPRAKPQIQLLFHLVDDSGGGLRGFSEPLRHFLHCGFRIPGIEALTDHMTQEAPHSGVSFPTQ